VKYLFLCLLISFNSANASLSFSFSQGGFDSGASVTGMFAGKDLDGNGQLSSLAGEVTDFSMSFSGNSIVSSFSLGFSDLVGLVYDLDGGSLGDGLNLDVEGVLASNGVFFYGLGINGGDVFEHFTNPSFSPELVTVTPTNVPVPSAVWLFISGFIGLLRISSVRNSG
jgi:hypothetical protein